MRYGPQGGEAIAPEALLALLFHGYATGVFSSRKIEKAAHENLAFRFAVGGLHPDHATIANFRKTFLVEIQELFVQILLLAKLAGVLKLGNLSLDGSKIHANASKSQAVSYKRLVVLEVQLRTAVQELLTLGEQADQGEAVLPESFGINFTTQPQSINWACLLGWRLYFRRSWSGRQTRPRLDTATILEEIFDMKGNAQGTFVEAFSCRLCHIREVYRFLSGEVTLRDFSLSLDNVNSAL
jgi:hypothetical protein